MSWAGAVSKPRVRHQRSASQALGWFCSVLTLTGCLVRASRYDQAVQQANLAHDDALHTRQELQARETELAELSAETHNLQVRLDEATALHQQLETALERLGKNVGSMLADEGAMQQALADAKARLAELRGLQAAAQARKATMASIAGQLKSREETRGIELTEQAGQTALHIPGSLLFEPGHVELKHSSAPVLDALAQVLASSPDWRFRIVAYASLPASKAHSRGVFDLVALRACHVADRLVALGLAPSSLSAGGRVDWAPAQPAGSAGRDDWGGVEIELVAAVPPTGSAGPGAPTSAPRASQ